MAQALQLFGKPETVSHRVAMAFVFYDTETTGISTCFDQILQFAAIKTDDDLNPIETFNAPITP